MGASRTGTMPCSLMSYATFALEEEVEEEEVEEEETRKSRPIWKRVEEVGVPVPRASLCGRLARTA